MNGSREKRVNVALCIGWLCGWYVIDVMMMLKVRMTSLLLA